MPYHLYVSLSGEDKILAFTIDAKTGKLTAQSAVAVADRPVNMAFEPREQFMYVGRKKAISTYRRNRETGELSLMGTVSLEFQPDLIFTDRKGRFLLSTYWAEGKVSVQKIGADGILTAIPVQWLDTARGVHFVHTDPSNKFVFVPCTVSFDNANAIFQFKFDEVTGQLTPNTPDRVKSDIGAGPRHLCFHPNMDFVYCSNEAGNSVTAYRFNPSLGTLSAFQTVSTVPDGYKGKSAPADIQITPSGRFIYVSNRGHNSIACFSVDPITGRLTSLGQVPAESNVRSIKLDPGGKFLYTAGLDSGLLVSYQVNPDTGELKPHETYTVGKGPWWLLITKPAN
jgi:6-phosphogluconolactonase